MIDVYASVCSFFWSHLHTSAEQRLHKKGACGGKNESVVFEDLLIIILCPQKTYVVVVWWFDANLHEHCLNVRCDCS